MRAAFGPFSFDLCALELRKNGIRLRLEEKPARLLACLIERRGEIVTREELRRRLWSEEVNLDFDHGLNKAVNKLRAVLGDSAAKPRYLETLSKRGYRFIQEIDEVPDGGGDSEAAAGPAPVGAQKSEAEIPVAMDATVEFAAAGSGERRRPHIWILISAALAAILVLLPAAGVLGRMKHVRTAGPKHVRIPDGLKVITIGDGTLALSPDGSRAAFVAAGPDSTPRLWLLDLDSSRLTELPGTDGGSMPFWSPDGTHIGFFTPIELKTIELSSYFVKVLAPVASARGGTWSAKGVILFASGTRGPIQRVPADGGAVVPVTTLNKRGGATTQRWPAFFPDGNHFVYLEANHDATKDPGRAMLASLSGDAPKFLVESDSNAVPDADHLIFVSNGNLLSVRLKPQALDPERDRQRLAGDIDCDRGAWYCAFSLNGNDVLYRPAEGRAERESISWFDAKGNKLADLGQPGIYRSVNLSPNGKTVAVTCGDPDQKVCFFDQDGTVTRLDSEGIVSGIVWSPDSSSFSYIDHRSDSEFGFNIRPIGRTAPARKLFVSQIDLSPIAWHPNGRDMLFSRARPGGTYELGILDLKTGETIPYLPEDKSEVLTARFSPDGKWVAFDRETGGLTQIYVASFPVPSILFPLTTEGGCAAKWRHDGHAIDYLGPGNTLYSVSLAPSRTGFRIGEPTPLFHPPIFSGVWSCISFDVSGDGSRFVVDTVPSQRAGELVSMSY